MFGFFGSFHQLSLYTHTLITMKTIINHYTFQDNFTNVAFDVKRLLFLHLSEVKHLFSVDY